MNLKWWWPVRMRKYPRYRLLDPPFPRRIYARRVHPFGKKDVALLFERKARDRGNKSKGDPGLLSNRVSKERGCFSGPRLLGGVSLRKIHSSSPPHTPHIATFLSPLASSASSKPLADFLSSNFFSFFFSPPSFSCPSPL